jgi:tetratricopeptide (TPR) repeat protein
VARAIAGQLRLQVSPSASGRPRARPVENVRAYECLLRARNHVYASNREALDAGLAEIDRAIEIAGPNPALLATRGLLCWQYFNSGVRPDVGMLDAAEELGREVLRLDPDSAQAQTLLGLVCLHRPDVPAAIRHLEAAVTRDPNDADAIGWLFAQYVMTGRDERARPLVARLAALDPVGWMATLAQPFMAMADGRFDEAVQLLDRVQVQGSFETTFRVMALCLARRFAEAEGVADEFLRRAPDDPFARIAGMYRFAIVGDRARVDELLNDSVRTVVRNDLQYSAWVAEVFALLGDAHQSAEWLRHAASRGYLAHPYVTTHDWLFDRVRSDPAMQDVLDEMRARWMAQR